MSTAAASASVGGAGGLGTGAGAGAGVGVGSLTPPVAADGTSLKFIDIGINLTDPIFTGRYRGKQKHPSDFDDVLQRARDVGCDRLIVTAGNLKESRAALRMVKDREGLFSTVGVHPTQAKSFGEDEARAEAHLEALIELAQEGKRLGKVVAAGEMGLDWARTHFCPQDIQIRNFERQFALVEATGLPMFLHDRETEGTFAELIRKHLPRCPAGGVIHSFTGSAEELSTYLDMGFHIGINGCSLKTADNLAAAASIPLDRLHLETDGPWCEIRATHAGHSHVKTKWPSKKPEKFAPGHTVKSRCEPCHIVQVAEVLAGIRDESFEEIVTAAHSNSMAMFFPGEASSTKK